MTQIEKEIQLELLFFFFIENAIHLSLGLFKKDVQATREAFSPQKRTPSTSKNEMFKKIFLVCGSFFTSWIRIWVRIANPDPDPGTSLNPDPIRIRIHSTAKISL
jgi:hypothetical protein